MTDSSLPFANELTDLTSDTSHPWSEQTKSRAPHKPFLLLSILDGIESGWIKSPSIKLSRDLKDTFYTYWNAIMRKDQVTTIALPFFHMGSEPFWELDYKEGMEPYKNTPSVGGLETRVRYALLDQRLFEHFSNPGERKQYRKLLLSTYFNNPAAEELQKLGTMNQLAFDYSEELLGLASEPFQKYSDKDAADRYADAENRRQVRDKGFRRAIRQIYEDTCALCRSRVVTKTDESLIEGAHIIPWENMGRDDIRNGLASFGTNQQLLDRY